MKKQQVLDEIFLKQEYEFTAGASIPDFKISTPSFCCCFFSKNISTPIYKMANTLSVDSQIKPLKLTSRLHPPIFVQGPQGLYLCPEYLFNIIYLFIPPGLKKTLKLPCQITGKCICKSKKIKLKIEIELSQTPQTEIF